MLAHLAFFLASVIPLDAPFVGVSFDQALAQAAKEKKIVMIDFFTTWCGPCKLLDKKTWPDADVQKWIGEHAVALRIDAEKERELAQRFKVEAYPTILFLKPDGTVIDRLLGFREPKKFLFDVADMASGKDAATRAKEEVARAKEKLVGHETDPMVRLEYAQTLASKELYDEALAEYLWCFDQGTETPAFVGVRASFLLSDIRSLGSKYPPALKALEKRRDDAEASLLTGRGTFATAQDFSALDRVLDARSRTLAVYEQLSKDGHWTQNFARAFGEDVIDQLVEARRYTAAVELIGGADSAFESATESYKSFHAWRESTKSEEKQAPEQLDSDMSMKRQGIEKGAGFYEAMLGAHKSDDATRLANQLIEFDATGATYAALIQHAVRAEDADAARAVADRAISALPDKEQRAVRVAMKRITAKK